MSTTPCSHKLIVDGYCQNGCGRIAPAGTTTPVVCPHNRLQTEECHTRHCAQECFATLDDRSVVYVVKLWCTPCGAGVDDLESDGEGLNARVIRSFITTHAGKQHEVHHITKDADTETVRMGSGAPPIAFDSDEEFLLSSPEELEKFSKKVLGDLDIKLGRVRSWIRFCAEGGPSSLKQQAPELLRAIDQARTLLAFVKVEAVK